MSNLSDFDPKNNRARKTSTNNKTLKDKKIKTSSNS